MNLDEISKQSGPIKPLGSVLEYYGKSGKLREDDSSKHDKKIMRREILEANINKTGNLIAVPKFIEK